MNKSKLILVVMACMMLTVVSAKNVVVTVTNEEKVQRQEVVEIDLYPVYKLLAINVGEPIVVKNALGQEVEYQISYDGKILIDVAVRPCGSAELTISAGNPKTMKTYVTGRMYPERVDDIAWENDRTAYRIYGPALQKSGERAFGVDVWVKNTPDLEVEKRYSTELSNHPTISSLKAQGKNEEAFAMEIATTYHFDHGYGLDCYKVGPTLGGGAPALMKDGELILPYCYKDYKILDNGPLRFTVQVSYNPTKINDDVNVIENRIISLDKGSNFNKCTVWYDGLTKPVPSKQNFQIYVGCLFPEGVKSTKKLMNKEVVNGNAGHAIGIVSYQSGDKYTYFFGSAWSKNDVRTMNEWKLRAEETINAIHSPLTITMK